MPRFCQFAPVPTGRRLSGCELWADARSLNSSRGTGKLVSGDYLVLRQEKWRNIPHVGLYFEKIFWMSPAWGALTNHGTLLLQLGGLMYWNGLFQRCCCYSIQSAPQGGLFWLVVALAFANAHQSVLKMLMVRTGQAILTKYRGSCSKSAILSCSMWCAGSMPGVCVVYMYGSVVENNPGRLVASEATYASKAHGLGKSGDIRYELNFSYFIDSTCQWYLLTRILTIIRTCSEYFRVGPNKQFMVSKFIA